jgi:beta-glucosidase/6-phospho-beta-glucosidase/beta-galactosidase
MDLTADPLFRSFFLGGFECSSHRLAGGRRLDLIVATGHERHADADYARLRDRGILAAREGIRWHLIESSTGRLDFSGVRPMIRAAGRGGIQVIWDLLHYGWPEDLDIFGPEFVRRFARLARGFAEVLAEEPDGAPWIAPINEISFLAWKGGEVAEFNPFARSRGQELKVQLVRASIAAIQEVRAVLPGARFAQIDPVFHVIADPDRPDQAEAAESYRLAQYQAWDMISGRLHPELGGRPDDLDVIGVNYYPWNQWIYRGETADGATIAPDHPGYRGFREILAEVAARYERPVFVAETGTEGDARSGWLSQVGHEVRAAIRGGAAIGGVCLYPILDFPGWENDRHCQSGLWGYADEAGDRPIHPPLARELARQVRRMEWLGAREPGRPRRRVASDRPS